MKKRYQLILEWQDGKREVFEFGNREEAEDRYLTYSYMHQCDVGPKHASLKSLHYGNNGPYWVCLLTF